MYLCMYVCIFIYINIKYVYVYIRIVGFYVEPLSVKHSYTIGLYMYVCMYVCIFIHKYLSMYMYIYVS
jgi:hypothetical protein